MVRTLWIWLNIFHCLINTIEPKYNVEVPNSINQIEDIPSYRLYAKFGPDVCPFVHELPALYKDMRNHNFQADHLKVLYENYNQENYTATVDIIENALEELAKYLYSHHVRRGYFLFSIIVDVTKLNMLR